MAHSNAISYAGARNAGEMSQRRRMCLPVMHGPGKLDFCA